MEWLNMMGHHSVRLWLAQVSVLLFLLGGIALLAMGISLIVNSAGFLRLIGSMNRWVSMRRATKPLEIPFDTRQLVQKYRHWFAALFVAGSVFAISGLLMPFNAKAVVILLGLRSLQPDLANWLVDSLRWLLILGNLTAIVVGVMLARFPDHLAAQEARGGRWYSEQQMTQDADDKIIKLDAWVAAYPRTSGGIIVYIALAMIAAFGLMLPRVW